MTISARDGLTIIERARRNVDWAAVERRERAEAERAIAERIKVLRHITFRNAARGDRDVEALTKESEAARLLILAGRDAHSRMVLRILELAIDNRWGQVITAGTRYFGEHPIAEQIRELWNLTTNRPAV